MYGKPFLNRHGALDSNNTWFLTLRDLTPKALESGVDRLRGLSHDGKFTEFAPNCLQFKALCLAFYEGLNLPSAAEAYREIKNSEYLTRQRFAHPIVNYIASRLPHDFLDMIHGEQAWALFKDAYEQVCSLVKQGHVLPERPLKNPTALRLEKPRSKATAHHYLRAMKQQLGVSA